MIHSHLRGKSLATAPREAAGPIRPFGVTHKRLDSGNECRLIGRKRCHSGHEGYHTGRQLGQGRGEAR
eukprot:898415-Prymnesium_polylepis.1